MDAWITGLISGLSGVAVGGVVASVNSWIQFRRDRGIKHSELIRSKVEETYQLVNELDNSFSEFQISHIKSSFQKGLINESDELWSQIPETHAIQLRSVSTLRARLKMLANLYIPGLTHLIRKLDKCFTGWIDAYHSERAFWIDASRNRPRKLTEKELVELSILNKALSEKGKEFAFICEEMRLTLSAISARTFEKNIVSSRVSNKEILNVTERYLD